MMTRETARMPVLSAPQRAEAAGHHPECADAGQADAYGCQGCAG